MAERLGLYGMNYYYFTKSSYEASVIITRMQDWTSLDTKALDMLI